MVGGGHRVSVIQRVENSLDNDNDDDRNIKTISSTALGHPEYSSETEKENISQLNCQQVTGCEGNVCLVFSDRIL